MELKRRANIFFPHILGAVSDKLSAQKVKTQTAKNYLLGPNETHNKHTLQMFHNEHFQNRIIHGPIIILLKTAI